MGGEVGGVRGKVRFKGHGQVGGLSQGFSGGMVKPRFFRGHGQAQEGVVQRARLRVRRQALLLFFYYRQGFPSTGQNPQLVAQFHHIKENRQV